MVCTVHLVELYFTHMFNVCPFSRVRTEADFWSNFGCGVSGNCQNVLLQIAKLANVSELPNAFSVRNVRRTFGKVPGRPEFSYDPHTITSYGRFEVGFV